MESGRIDFKEIELKYRFDLGPYVTFVPNKSEPVYNWFYFKEGYSRRFVLTMLDHFRLNSSNWVLDPFLGVGTTLLGCKERGINGVGIEVNPLFLFVANAKLIDYDIDSLKKWSTWLFNQKFKRPDISNLPSIIKIAFNRYNLEDIVFFKNKINEIDDDNARSFLLLALINAASKVTYAYKDGAVIKFIKKDVPPFRPFYKRIVRKMIRDLKTISFKKCTIKTILGDARIMDDVDDSSIDAIITSPPYLNKIEYTKVYEIEMKLFLGETVVNPIRSYIGLIPRKPPLDLPDFLDELNLPPAAQLYFSDMWIVLKQMYRVLRDGGKIAMVVAEGIFPDRIVESDLILARMGVELGFRNPEIWIVNKRVATRDRTIKIGVARESIVFLAK